MSIEDLISCDLLMDKRRVFEIGSNASQMYKKIMIGKRRIDSPEPELKLIQSWISDFIRCETVELPEFVAAYEPGSSIRKNALIHNDADHLICFDICSFFHSCKEVLIRDFYRKVTFCEAGSKTKRGLTDLEVDLLVSLSSYRGSLSMGSPCSPAIANRIMFPIDMQIQDQLGHKYSYSRYSDDICVSSKQWIDYKEVTRIIQMILANSGFKLNESKTHCYGLGDRRRVTGIFINPDGTISIGAKRKKQLSSRLYQYLVNSKGSAEELLGHIYFAISIDPLYINSVLGKYADYGKAAYANGVMDVLKNDIANSK